VEEDFFSSKAVNLADKFSVSLLIIKDTMINFTNKWVFHLIIYDNSS
jgi:hypothetical protein